MAGWAGLYRVPIPLGVLVPRGCEQVVPWRAGRPQVAGDRLAWLGPTTRSSRAHTFPPPASQLPPEAAPPPTAPLKDRDTTFQARRQQPRQDFGAGELVCFGRLGRERLRPAAVQRVAVGSWRGVDLVQCCDPGAGVRGL